MKKRITQMKAETVLKEARSFGIKKYKESTATKYVRRELKEYDIEEVQYFKEAAKKAKLSKSQQMIFLQAVKKSNITREQNIQKLIELPVYDLNGNIIKGAKRTNLELSEFVGRKATLKNLSMRKPLESIAALVKKSSPEYFNASMAAGMKEQLLNKARKTLFDKRAYRVLESLTLNEVANMLPEEFANLMDKIPDSDEHLSDAELEAASNDIIEYVKIIRAREKAALTHKTLVYDDKYKSEEF